MVSLRENSCRFSELGDNKQLLIVNVVFSVFFIHLLNFKILNAPWITKTKTIVPIIRSGLLELNQFTNSPATITPKLIITSFEVKIMLALI